MVILFAKRYYRCYLPWHSFCSPANATLISSMKVLHHSFHLSLPPPLTISPFLTFYEIHSLFHPIDEDMEATRASRGLNSHGGTQSRSYQAENSLDGTGNAARKDREDALAYSSQNLAHEHDQTSHERRPSHLHYASQSQIPPLTSHPTHLNVPGAANANNNNSAHKASKTPTLSLTRLFQSAKSLAFRNSSRSLGLHRQQNSRISQSSNLHMRRFVHQVGWLMALFQCVRAVDPFGALGFYSLATRQFLSYNISNLEIVVVGAFAFSLAGAAYKMMKKDIPRFFKPTIKGLILSLIIVDNVLLVVTAMIDRGWPAAVVVVGICCTRDIEVGWMGS